MLGMCWGRARGCLSPLFQSPLWAPAGTSNHTPTSDSGDRPGVWLRDVSGASAVLGLTLLGNTTTLGLSPPAY